jgi:RNA polymerase sigma factor (sigma-70 family)
MPPLPPLPEGLRYAFRPPYDLRNKPPKLKRRQQQLADKFIPMAHKIARKFWKKFGGDYDEWSGYALFALSLAAGRFNPKFKVDGKYVQPMTFLYRSVWTTMITARRYIFTLRSLERDFSSFDRVQVPTAGWASYEARIPAPESDVEEKLDLEDVVAVVRSAIDDICARYSEPTRSKIMPIVEGRIFGTASLEALGAQLGVSKERVRQIQRDILTKLANHSRVQKLAYDRRIFTLPFTGNTENGVHLRAQAHQRKKKGVSRVCMAG